MRVVQVLERLDLQRRAMQVILNTSHKKGKQQTPQRTVSRRRDFSMILMAACGCVRHDWDGKSVDSLETRQPSRVAANLLACNLVLGNLHLGEAAGPDGLLDRCAGVTRGTKTERKSAN